MFVFKHFPYNNTNGENTELGIRGQQSHFQRQFEILKAKPAKRKKKARQDYSTPFTKFNGAGAFPDLGAFSTTPTTTLKCKSNVTTKVHKIFERRW